MIKPKLLAVVMVSVLIAVPSVVSAVEYGGVGGTPANPRPDNPRTKSIFIYQLKPGQRASDGVRIYNNTDKQRTISVYPVDSVLSSGGAFACAQQVDPKTDVGNWVQLSSNQVTLAANSSRVIPFAITASKHADVGEHDGCIVIQDASMSRADKGQNGVVLGFRSAIRVAVTIPGKLVKQLSITDVKIAKLKDGNYSVATVARNNGNVSLDTNIKVKLMPVFGGSAGQTQGTYPILPHSSAGWNFNFKHPVWGGWYRATASAAYNDNPASALGRNEGSLKTVRLSSSLIYANPTGIAAIIEVVILLLIVGILIWIVKRQQRRKHIRRHWREYTVQANETINKIAGEHNTSWKKIASANKLKPPYHLEKGQKLRLPPKSKE